MATVTGFTAERMLEMEDATVIDGSVVGDDLVLVTKGGTPINTGSVRGPQGTPGTNGTNGLDGATGPPGPVSSVNDQLGAVYSPRTFANKAALDLWTPSDGAMAWTLDSHIIWIRLAGVWRTYQQKGTGTFVFSADIQVTTNITFPYPFAAAPIVMGISAAITNNTVVYINTAGVSPTAVNFLCRTGGGSSYSGNLGFYWMATMA